MVLLTVSKFKHSRLVNLLLANFDWRLVWTWGHETHVWLEKYLEQSEILVLILLATMAGYLKLFQFVKVEQSQSYEGFTAKIGIKENKLQPQTT